MAGEEMMDFRHINRMVNTWQNEKRAADSNKSPRELALQKWMEDVSPYLSAMYALLGSLAPDRAKDLNALTAQSYALLHTAEGYGCVGMVDKSPTCRNDRPPREGEK